MWHMWLCAWLSWATLSTCHNKRWNRWKSEKSAVLPVDDDVDTRGEYDDFVCISKICDKNAQSAYVCVCSHVFAVANTKSTPSTRPNGFVKCPLNIFHAITPAHNGPSAGGAQLIKRYTHRHALTYVYAAGQVYNYTCIIRVVVPVYICNFNWNFNNSNWLGPFIIVIQKFCASPWLSVQLGQITSLDTSEFPGYSFFRNRR